MGVVKQDGSNLGVLRMGVEESCDEGTLISHSVNENDAPISTIADYFFDYTNIG